MNRKEEVFQELTQKLLERMENGIIPWMKPWQEGLWPQNYAGRKYNGYNAMVLRYLSDKTQVWVTKSQIAKHYGAHYSNFDPSPYLKPNAEKMPILGWASRYDRDEKTGQKTMKNGVFPIVHYVYNVEHTDLPIPEKAKIKPREHEPVKEAETIINEMRNAPQIEFNQNVKSPCYVPSEHRVIMPKPEQFHNTEEYYGAFFHELTHSTSHKSCVGRKIQGIAHGIEEYSQEELVAEMGSAYLLNECGLMNESIIENHAAYLRHWHEFIKENPGALIYGAQQSRKATEYILNRKQGE